MTARRRRIAADRTALAMLKFVSRQDAVQGENLARAFGANLLRKQIAEVERARQPKITLRKYRAAARRADSRKDLAKLLGVSRQAVRIFEKKRGISTT